MRCAVAPRCSPSSTEPSRTFVARPSNSLAGELSPPRLGAVPHGLHISNCRGYSLLPSQPHRTRQIVSQASRRGSVRLITSALGGSNASPRTWRDRSRRSRALRVFSAIVHDAPSSDGGDSGGKLGSGDRVVPANGFCHETDPLEPRPQVLRPVGTRSPGRGRGSVVVTDWPQPSGGPS